MNDNKHFENLMYLPQLSLTEHHAIQEIMTTEQSLNYPLDILDKKLVL